MFPRKFILSIEFRSNFNFISDKFRTNFGQIFNINGRCGALFSVRIPGFKRYQFVFSDLSSSFWCNSRISIRSVSKTMGRQRWDFFCQKFQNSCFLETRILETPTLGVASPMCLLCQTHGRIFEKSTI